MASTRSIKNTLTKSRNKKLKIPRDDYLSCGSTMVNMACTGKPFGCISKGRYMFFVGDSDSGKTFLCLTLLAEACHNAAFDEHRLIFDNAEDGALMDLRQFFGKDIVDRLEAPRYDEDDQPIYSEHVEDFYDHVDDAIDDGRPFIYILDSMDALDTLAEEKKAKSHKKVRRGKGNKSDEAGTFGADKAKLNSTNLRRIRPKLRKNGSILIIISQTRDNLGFGMEKKTRSGGRALKFYAHMEVWTASKGKITKTVKGKKRELGIMSKVLVKKNRYNGRKREVEVPIYHSYGVDDIGSCIDYLISENHWKKAQGGSSITAEDFDFKGSRDKLIQMIEEENLEKELQLIVSEVWDEIEEACKLQRKKKYA